MLLLCDEVDRMQTRGRRPVFTHFRARIARCAYIVRIFTLIFYIRNI